MENFINEPEIHGILEESRNPSPSEIRDIIEKARSLKGLGMKEAALLLECRDPELIEGIFEAAKYVKESIYGNRLVLFAPLYINNRCVNNCLYCAFRMDNRDLARKSLDISEIRLEAEAIQDEGHKRVLLVSSEGPPADHDVDFIVRAIRAVYDTKKKRGEIRRVNVNIAPLTAGDFRKLKAAGIGTYQLFQETYHPETYKKVHPSGPKSDYDWRLYAMDRAMEAGIDDVGVGALFGLYDHRFEVLALLAHSLHLEEKFGAGPHTISVPRIKYALNAPLSREIPYPLSDEVFKKLVAVIRLAVPYTGIILSTREGESLREELFELGVSQISAGSKTGPGAYNEGGNTREAGQFRIEDGRSQAEVIDNIIEKGFFPSFCTACYRTGRTGKDFMDLAKPGDIKEFCLPNSILTFKEYVLDYGGEDVKERTKSVIERELNKISDKHVLAMTREKLMGMEEGERDIFF